MRRVEFVDDLLAEFGVGGSGADEFFAGPLIEAIDSDRFEHYLPDMKAVIEAKTADIDAFMVGMRALNDRAGS